MTLPARIASALLSSVFFITRITTLLVPASACAGSSYYDHPFVMGVGVHSGQGRAPFSKGAPVLSYAGASSTRQEASWSRIELTKGELKYPANLKDVEDYVDDAVKRGGQPLLVLDYGNKYYDGGDGVFSEEGIEGFARYAAFMANHFKGRVKFYEVWNEWDIGLGSNKNPRTVRDVATYIKLLKATYRALKATDPSAQVFGAVATTSHTDWINTFIKEGGLDYLDGFSTHPYLMWNIQSKPEHSIASLDDLHLKIEAARPMRRIPIYVTEIGWPTHNGPIAWTPEQVGDFVIRFHLLARLRPFIGGVWWYSLANDAREQDNKEKAFGLVDFDYNAKPALEAYKVTAGLISELASIRKKSKTPHAPEDIALEMTLTSGEKCQATWITHTPAKNIQLSTPSIKGRTLWGKHNRLGETPFIHCE